MQSTALFFRYESVTKVLKLHLIDFFTVQTIHKKGLNSVRCTDANILDLNNAKLTEIFLYGKENFGKMNYKRILDTIIRYLIETKRLDGQLFFFKLLGCNAF